MVHGKLKGAVTYVDAKGNRLQATFVSGEGTGEHTQPATRPLTPRSAPPSASQPKTDPDASSRAEPFASRTRNAEMQLPTTDGDPHGGADGDPNVGAASQAT